MGEPRPGAYDRLAADYDAREVGPRWVVYDHVTWATLAPWLPPPGARVLDAGAGSGKFALRFLQRGDAVTLLDPSAEMLRVAEAKVRAAFPQGRAAFVQGGIERLDFPDAAFDVVFCEGDPLSYCIGTHRQAAKELLRVLRPGGAFYVSVDNRWMGVLGFLARGEPERAWAAADQGRTMDPYGMPTHGFAAEELRATLLEAGAAEVRVAGKVVLLNFLPEPTIAGYLADPHHRERLLALEVALAQDPAMAGLGGHLHAVGRKA
jgi:ubiquinone/menaquinone biosynthesis C-methylase UbiE